MYKSWIPRGVVGRTLTRLEPDDRKLVARCVASIAREFDWGICADAAGNYLFRYFSDLNWVADPTEPIEWLEEARVPGTEMKAYFRFVYSKCLGSCCVVDMWIPLLDSDTLLCCTYQNDRRRRALSFLRHVEAGELCSWCSKIVHAFSI